jgi:hypothetical protein
MKKKQPKKNLNKKSSKDHENFKNSQKMLESSNSLISDNKVVDKFRLDYLKKGFKNMVNIASEGHFNEKLYNTLFSLDCPDLALLAQGLKIISDFANHLKESK